MELEKIVLDYQIKFNQSLNIINKELFDKGNELTKMESEKMVSEIISEKLFNWASQRSLSQLKTELEESVC